MTATAAGRATIGQTQRVNFAEITAASPVLMALERDGDRLRRLTVASQVPSLLDPSITLINWNGSIVIRPQRQEIIEDFYRGLDLLHGRGSHAWDVNQSAAFEALQRAAEGGFAPAQTSLALNLLSSGRSNPPDQEAGLLWLERAASGGDVLAQAELGRRYARGQGVPRNDELAVFWLKLAAQLQNPDACWELACLYKGGRGGLTSDPVTEEPLIKIAADAFHSEASCAYGEILERRGDLAGALEMYKGIGCLFGPVRGRSLLRSLLGHFYEHGLLGRTPDLDNAEKLHIEATKLDPNCEMAWYRCGLFYAKARHDDNKAVVCFQRAARLGCGLASLELARRQLANKGGGKKARPFFEAAARENIPEALYHLSKLTEDPDTASNLLRRAATGGFVTAQMEYGKHLFDMIQKKGRGLVDEVVLATTYLDLAASNGDLDAQLKLGLLLLDVEVAATKERGLDLIKDAAAKGFPAARFQIVTFEIEGRLLPKNEAHVLAELESLAADDHPESISLLGHMLINRGPGNMARGITLVDRAAAAGVASAMHTAFMIYDSDNLEMKSLIHSISSPADALQMLKRSAKKGYGKAEVTLGSKYLRGDGCPLDVREGERLSALGAEHGDPVGWNNIGGLYYRGWGETLVDKSKAFAFYLRAARAGCPEAMVNVGDYCLREALPLETFDKQQIPGPNERAAMRWYLEAESKGCPEASLRLGDLWMKGGPDRPPRPGLAEQCWLKAAAAGLVQATARLYQLKKAALGGGGVVASVVVGSEGLMVDFTPMSKDG